MAKISVYLHGELISELEFAPGQEYFAGRGSQSQIQLASERGISRQHVKFFEQDGVWHAELLSKYGGMILENQNVDRILLKGTIRFSVPPYDFVFEESSAGIDLTSPIHDISKPTPDLIAPENNAVEIEPKSPPAKPTPQTTPFTAPQSQPQEAFRDDRTMVAQPARLIPYLKIVNNKLKTEEVLKLEGSTWQVGRSNENEIVINDNAISRKHLELIKKDIQFFVIDHGSSNGTKLNGHSIEPASPQLIQSGDVLTVRHLELILELHNAEIEEEKSLSIKFDDTDFELTDGGARTPMTTDPIEGVVMKVDPWHSKEQLKKRALPFGVAFALILGIYGVTRPNSQPRGSKNNPSKAPSLTVEQQKQVADFFNLAHNYYTQRKYTLCLSQLDRMKRLAPFYSNSKELENLCEQGQEDEARALDRQRREQEQEATQAKIQANVDQCRGKLSPSITDAQMRTCLDPAIELDPENPMVKDLLHQADIREQQAKSQIERAQEYADRKAEGKRLFDSAETAYRRRQQQRALEQYRQFMRGEYPGLNQDEDVAKRRIASIERTIDQKVQAAISACQNDFTSDNLKAALKECDAALADRPKNERAVDLRKRAYARLSDEMKNIYEDSVLEENMGNLDSAKDKWMQIVHHSVRGENYYEKARSKLRTYGVDI